MSLPALAYDAALRLLRGASPLVAGGASKLARGVRGRAGAVHRMTEWAGESREPALPLLWLHAPSVGEGHQARAVLDAVREEAPEFQSIFTFFSPSAEAFARGMPVDAADYLPWDVRGEMDALVEVVRPGLVAFTKTEVWPGVRAAAAAKGVPVVLIAATLPERSGRLNPLARPFLASVFGSLDRVLAISEEDGARFRRLGVPATRIEVTGDPGIDSAWRRAHESDLDAPHLAPLRADPRPTLVAGSTWPADERILLPVVERVRERFDELRVVIAPHEPTEDHVAELLTTFGNAGLRARRLGEFEEAGSVEGVDAVVVDRVGVLADLYAVGRIAYVGGGFGRDGLHSVLEPAAAGLPTLFGPRFEGSRSAVDLLRVGGAAAVEDGNALGAALERWLDDESVRATAAGRAREYIEIHRGAAKRTAVAMARLLAGA